MRKASGAEADRPPAPVLLDSLLQKGQAVSRYSFKSAGREHSAFQSGRSGINELRQAVAAKERVIQQLREENERLKRQLQEPQNGSQDAEMGEYLRLRYAGQFGTPQAFLRAIDIAFGPGSRFGGGLPSRIRSR